MNPHGANFMSQRIAHGGRASADGNALDADGSAQPNLSKDLLKLIELERTASDREKKLVSKHRADQV